MLAGGARRLNKGKKKKKKKRRRRRRRRRLSGCNFPRPGGLHTHTLSV